MLVSSQLKQLEDDSTSVREGNDGFSHDVGTDDDKSDFSWFEEDSSSGDNRYTFRSEPKHRWLDYSEYDDDLGDIPVDWIKKEPKESMLPQVTHNSVSSSLFERVLDGLSGSIRDRVMDQVEFVKKAKLWIGKRTLDGTQSLLPHAIEGTVLYNYV
ncbi:hypothetical protein K439DRAFT_1622949 [Ramaria rubella]|nr:hypothetical protein K439DRAFT_1622949 [Ramaria rubella]